MDSSSGRSSCGSRDSPPAYTPTSSPLSGVRRNRTARVASGRRLPTFPYGRPLPGPLPVQRPPRSGSWRGGVRSPPPPYTVQILPNPFCQLHRSSDPPASTLRQIQRNPLYQARFNFADQAPYPMQIQPNRFQRPHRTFGDPVPHPIHMQPYSFFQSKRTNFHFPAPLHLRSLVNRVGSSLLNSASPFPTEDIQLTNSSPTSDTSRNISTKSRNSTPLSALAKPFVPNWDSAL